MGDTVTMPWWSETYLNEGFARYLQYVGVQYLFPEWHVLTADSSMINIYGFAYNPALKQDTTASYGPSIAPQSQVSGNATSAKDSFGYLSYSKGGSLNYYFNRILGDDIWNRALGIQVNKHAYTNPTYVDLVNSLNAAVGDDSMQELLEMWLTQAGYPIIDVHYDEDDSVYFYLFMSLLLNVSR
jgi:aminopeptidase N